MKTTNKNSGNVLEVKRENQDKTPADMLPNVHKIADAKVVEMTANSTGDAKTISEAIRKKTVVVDLKNKKILAFTDTTIIEIDEIAIKSIEKTVRGELAVFEKSIKKDGFKANNVSNILVKFEEVHAAFLNSNVVDQTRKKLNEVLAYGIKNGNDDTKRCIRNGITSFFARSKSSIATEPIKFAAVPYIINNREEKEYFRNEFISKMLAEGVVDYSFLVEGGIISNLDFITLDEVFRKQGLLTNEEFENACYLADLFEERNDILDYYAKKDKKFFSSFATLEEIIQYLSEGKIEAKYLSKRLRIDEVKKLTPELLEKLLEIGSFPKGIEFIDFIQTNRGTDRILNSNFLKSLDRNQLMKVVMSQKIKYRNPLKSDDYIDLFETLMTEDIKQLLKNGFVNSEDIIKLMKYKSMEKQNPDEYNSMVELQMQTYNFDKLVELLNANKINKRFSTLFNEFINGLSDEQREQYFKVLQERVKQVEKGEESLVLLSKVGINLEQLDYKISVETVEELYMEDKISEQDILKIYEKKLISVDSLKSIFSNEDLIEHYKIGNIDYRVLNLIEERADFIREELLNGKIDAFKLMNLYSAKDGIEIDEFFKIVKDYNFEEQSLTDFITDEITPKKVEELFKNYYISQDDLSNLVARNIISKEDAREFADRIATQEEYESIFNNDNGFIVLTEDTPEGEHNVPSLRGGGDKRASQIKNDPELQELLLEQIGFDERRPVLRGANNSLDGYRIYPSKELALMVFLKNDKPGNAAYIMSLQQGMYFLKKIVRDGKSNAEQNETKIESDATKQGLRETEHVKVRNASAGWGKNVVAAMKSLSPELKKKLAKSSEYKSNLDVIIEEIKKDYEERKKELEEK